MRIPLREDNDLGIKINSICNKISDKFFTVLKPNIEMNKIDVMLGDCTITQAGTFDIKNVSNSYLNILKRLKRYNWEVSDILSSHNEDLYRLYFQISKDINKFRISGYFGIQYHVLSYYKIDKRVLEIKTEIRNLEEYMIQNTNKIMNTGNELIKNELYNLGYKDLSLEELISTIFDNQEIMIKLEKKIHDLEDKIPENNQLNESKNKLVSELNQMIIELYNISPNILDYNKMMYGEVGVICYFDIETIKNKSKNLTEPYINIEAVNKENKIEIIDNFNTIHTLLNNSSS